jgi:hypothetical protein
MHFIAHLKVELIAMDALWIAFSSLRSMGSRA